jgi:thioredoxin-like negative regulator of GroEL
MLSRREQIEAMLADEPADVFLRYSLALELAKENEQQRSLELLRGLMTGQTPYVPAFLMAAQQLAEMGRLNEATAALGDGIEQARRQGNPHAAGEMSELLAALGAARGGSANDKR